MYGDLSVYYSDGNNFNIDMNILYYNNRLYLNNNDYI